MGLLRKIMIEARNRIENREEKDLRIRENFFSYVPEETEGFFIYASCNSEADTTGIIRELFEKGKKVYCPKTVGREIEFFEIRSFEDLKPGFHNIPEPFPKNGESLEEFVEKYSVHPTDMKKEIMVVPGLVFDEECGRMGYGSGNYDRYLTLYPCKKAALAYEVQIREDPLDLNKDDVYMDAVITEKKIRERVS